MILRKPATFLQPPGSIHGHPRPRQAAVINLTKVMGKDYATLGKAIGKEAFVRKRATV